MKPHEPNHLLKEILAGDELADFRQASLEHGLTALRRQQRYRRGRHIGMLISLPLLVTLAVLSRRVSLDSNRQTASPRPATSPARTPPTDGRDAKTITDEELFALFPNRPMALVGKPGKQQLVFLDAAPRSRHP